MDATMHKRDRFISARNWGEGASQPTYCDSKGTYGLTYYRYRQVDGVDDMT